eukprot:4431572-Prorocentrum_lima.AAC.1
MQQRMQQQSQRNQEWSQAPRRGRQRHPLGLPAEDGNRRGNSPPSAACAAPVVEFVAEILKHVRLRVGGLRRKR